MPARPRPGAKPRNPKRCRRGARKASRDVATALHKRPPRLLSPLRALPFIGPGFEPGLGRQCEAASERRDVPRGWIKPSGEPDAERCRPRSPRAFGRTLRGTSSHSAVDKTQPPGASCPPAVDSGHAFTAAASGGLYTAKPGRTRLEDGHAGLAPVALPAAMDRSPPHRERMMSLGTGGATERTARPCGVRWQSPRRSSGAGAAVHRTTAHLCHVSPVRFRVASPEAGVRFVARGAASLCVFASAWTSKPWDHVVTKPLARAAGCRPESQNTSAKDAMFAAYVL